jgi:hypothetical protein
LNHRKLEGADIKVVWDLNRWTQIVRIAQASYLTGESRYREIVLKWLESWVKANRPFRGWNWTSSLEAAIRLLNFVWLDALLREEMDPDLRDAIVVPHFHYIWRHRSFGSSANNHWLGELAGLIVARCRWQIRDRGVPSLEKLKALFEREVLMQFDTDGGNKEQAFHYHLFSFDFIMHVYFSVTNGGLSFSQEFVDRVRSAASFLVQMQSPDGRWDYGDSDDAVVVPFGREISTSSIVWTDWINPETAADDVSAWLGHCPFSVPKKRDGWRLFSQSGYGVYRDDQWFVRVDGSPLGYLSIAAHGHLDAMHMSVWFRSRALIVDPGTGSYYFDPEIRRQLAEASAHNGPTVEGDDLSKRRGIFMWGRHHARPAIGLGNDEDLMVELSDHNVKRGRRIQRTQHGWIVEDKVTTAVPVPFAVKWTFAPGVEVAQEDRRSFRICSDEAVLWLRVDQVWESVILESTTNVSPSFRVLASGPAIILIGESNRPRPFETVLESQP